MMTLILAAWLMAFRASAVEVAFLEFHTDDGQVVELEPGGRYLHVAIRVGGQWLHAHTHQGVVLVDTLEPYGHRIIRLVNHTIPDPKPEMVATWLGKPFDRTYSWYNPEATYCTRLVADLLGISPQPMTFASRHWKNSSMIPVGQLGLSPDDLFWILRTRGFSIKAHDCEDFLAH